MAELGDKSPTKSKISNELDRFVSEGLDLRGRKKQIVHANDYPTRGNSIKHPLRLIASISQRISNNQVISNADTAAQTSKTSQKMIFSP